MDKEYQSLIIPKLKWNKKELSNTFGELTVEPLEQGFGMTLGNAVRRVVLGGVEGSAITSVIIKGVNNEFSSVPGVMEDTMQLVLNIKEIVIRNKQGTPGTMHLSFKGEGIARVSDIKADAHLELVNPDHVLAHVGKDGELDITFFVESGRGYQRALWPADKALQEDSRIYLDAMFSPVKTVTFDVEKTRIGEDIDYDKLIIKITTNGAENPIDVLHYGVSVLRTQLEHFLTTAEIPFNQISDVPEKETVQDHAEGDEPGAKGLPVELLLKPIDELELSVRAHNCLKNAGIKRVLDLVNLSSEESLKIKNFGRKSLNEVQDSMKSFGLSFGMNIKESDLKKMLRAKDKEDKA
jgi:DNA-directed RNA polymerase subunit alpha